MAEDNSPWSWTYSAHDGSHIILGFYPACLWTVLEKLVVSCLVIWIPFWSSVLLLSWFQQVQCAKFGTSFLDWLGFFSQLEYLVLLWSNSRELSVLIYIITIIIVYITQWAIENNEPIRVVVDQRSYKCLFNVFGNVCILYSSSASLKYTWWLKQSIAALCLFFLFITVITSYRRWEAMNFIDSL